MGSRFLFVLLFLGPYRGSKLGLKFVHNASITSWSSGIYTTKLHPILLSKHTTKLEVGRNGVVREEAQSKAASGIYPSIPIDDFVCMLQEYAYTKSLAQGKSVHAHMFITGLDHEVILMSKLVTMYVRCGSMNDARQLFDKMPKQSVFLWNEMIRGYVRYGFYEEALAFYHQMQHFNINPDNFTFPCVLKACAGLSDLQQGREIHDLIMRSRLESDHFVGNALVTMYAKCGSLEDARHIFDTISQRNVVSWNAMIAGYAQNGHGNEALELFHEMQRAGVKLDSFTLATVLSASSCMGVLQQGKQIHACVIRGGFECDVFVGSALVDMYAKCGSMDDASHLFDKMPERNVVSWNAMIAGYAQNGCHKEALNILRQMKQAGEKADSVTIGCALSACAHLQALQQGKEIHNDMLRTGFELDVFVSSALLDMYAKCGNLENAVEVFDKMCHKNVVTWNAMIAGYAQNGRERECLDFIRKMQQAGEKPDSTTVASVLPVCAHLSALQNGREIHSYIYSTGLESDVYVGCALIDMYSKCKMMEHAHKVFDKIYKRDAVQWSALIAGYAQNGQGDQAIELFHQMKVEGIKPTSITIASVLPVCADLTALRKGKEIHSYMFRNGIESDVFVGSALVDTYAKCGSIEAAHRTFDMILKKNVVSWNTIIAGYGMHGYGEDALKLFHEMQQVGLNPNYITFIAILSACSHAGLVDKGWQYFESMSHQYGIIPMVEHYTCMVDILGRAGLLDEALEFIKEMPLQPDAGLWGALLGACRIHCNVELGQRVAQHIFELEPQDTGYYVLMSNMYAEAGRWDEVKRVRTLMKDKWLNKKPGSSWIEVKKKVYAFIARDRSYPQSQEIHAMLENLAGQMKEGGYEPARNFALQDVEDEDKEFNLCCHSEKLAIAFGLINEFPGIPIRVTKNLRVCGDCHTATKFISKIVRREIIVRDASRFHHFKDGTCSCRDYW